MALLCRVIPPARICTITLPGAVQLSGADITGQLQMALAPMTPIFKIVEVVQALIAVVEAIPDAIALDPTAINAALIALGVVVPELTALVPALSFPRMIRDTVDCVIGLISDVRLQLLSIIQLKGELDAIAAHLLSDPPESPGLQFNYDCAVIAFNANFNNLASQLQTLNTLVAMLNTLGGLVPGGVIPTIPDLSTMTGLDPADALTELDSITAALTVVRDAIPVI